MEQNRWDALQNAGIDLPDALRRMAGNTELPEKFLMRFPEDDNFGILGRALDGADWDTALIAVHTLKGISGNLGMGRLCQCCCRMVEQLRAGDTAGARASYNELAGVYRALCGALKGGV